ncbi:hypothetical protein A0J61_04683 [Choanephora cucurbitarum]|uniref:Myb-like domain-containing protein n=1 Tax=Choanephora cucurbitarum TaxID=101091 RepID=A0A1C7NEU0_9FUNG|nr:hypothetical protein A0J61_04683 [Choanephora cucurbitarum]
MLDTLKQRVKEEIAIDGDTGSNINDVWKYVQQILKEVASQSNVSITPLVDERYKQFFWKYLAAESDLTFYESANEVTPMEEDTSQSIPEADEQPLSSKPDSVDQPTEEPIGNSEVTQQQVEEDEEEILANKKRKRPPPKKKKKPVAKKPKKKKAAKKKRVAVGDSDDDFVDDDVSESSSESEFDELISSEEEEPQEEEEDVDLLLRKHMPKGRREPPSIYQKSHPKTIETGQKTRVNKQDLKLIQDIQQLSYEQVVEKYGDRLIIIASAELQEEQLYVNVPPGNILSPNLVAVLKEIIKTRKEGLYQANITKLLQLDSRSTGHYVKSLEEKGAITRSGVSINSMYTNICIHARFNGEKTKLDMNTVGNDKKSNQIPYNVNAYGKVYSQRMVLDAFVEFAQGAPNKIIVARDVLHALGFDSTRRQVQKWYNRVIDEICMKGYFKKHNVQVEEKGHRFRGLELLNEPIDKSTTNVTTSVDAVELPIRIESNQKDIPVIHLLWDLSVEAQCLQVISAAGANGVTQKDISFALNIDEQRVMNKALEHLVDPKSHVNDRYRVVRFLEFDRRLKRYRYYTKAAHLKMTENIDLPPQPMPSPGLDISKCYERNIFYDAPHDTTNFNKFIDLYVKARTNKNTVLNALHASTSYNGFAGKPVSVSKTRLAKSLTAKKTNQREGTRSQTLHTNSVDKPADQAPSSSISLDPSPVLSVTEDSQTLPSSTIIDETTIIKRKRGRPAGSGKGGKASTKKPRKSAGQTTVEVEQQPKLPNPAESSIATRFAIQEQINTQKETVPFNDIPEDQPKPQTESIIPDDSTNQSVSENRNNVPVEPVIAVEAPAQSAPMEATNASESSLPAASEPIAEPMIVDSNKETASNDQRESTPSSQTSSKGTSKKKTIADYFKRAPKKPSVPVEKTPSPVPAAQESETTSVSPSIISVEKEANQLTEEATKNNVESTEQASAEPMDICEPSSTEPLSNNPADQTAHLAPEEQAEPSTCESSTMEEPHGETSHNDLLQSLAVDNFDYDRLCSYDSTVPQGKQSRILVNGVWVYHHKPKHRRNPYAAARMKAMVMIVWKRRMTEFDRDFRNEYLKILGTLNTVHKGTVCNKTIWKTALDAQEEGLVKTNVVTISLLSGATIDRKTIIRGDIDLEGEEYQKFVSLMKDRKVLSTSQYGFSSTGVTNIPVERLDARLARMQEEANNQQDVAKAKLMEERVSELSKNLNLFSRKKQAAAPLAWMISALQFGWIQAIMVRARILYEQIIRLLDTDTEGVFPEERLMNATTIIKSMSVGTVCQIIGLHQPSKRLASFVKDPDNADLVFDQLPTEIRAELFGEPNKFRRRLRVIFQVLQYIEVITPVFPGESEGQSRPAYVEYAPQYRVEPVVEIRDRRIVGEPIRYVKHVNNVEDARSLFSDLQYVYVNPSAHPSPESSVASLPEDPVLLQLFKTTHNRNNWSTTSVFSAERRKHINTYIDKKNFTTPLDNTTLMRQISREADCPIYALRLYYQKAQALLNQKKLKSELQYVMSRSRNSGKRVRRGKRVDLFDGRRVIKKDSAHAFVSRKYERHLIVLPHVDMETVRSHTEENEKFAAKRSKGELLFMDDMKDLPVLPSDDNASHLRKPRGKRFVWTRRDDELLMYANIVLRQRTGRQRFSWIPIVKQFFPETPFSSCRHRYTKLMRLAEWKELFETHTYLWHKIYDEGLAKGEIEDKDPEDNINCDLLGLVTYFIQKLSENTPENLPSDNQPLPKTIQEFHANLEIANRPNKSFSYLHDAFHESHTMARKTQVLYSQAFNLHRYDAKRLDQSEAAIESDLDKNSRDAKLCRSFALMSLMTPSEYYDPFYCYSVFQQFPKRILDDTFKKMRDDGTLVLTSQDRPIPGTRFSLSEKFMRCMAGQLPNNIFQQANEYEKFLRQQNGMIRFTSDYASSGMIACLLNLVSDNKLSMAPVNLNRILKAMSEENFHIRSIDARLVRFDINVEILEKEDQVIPYMPSAEQPQIKQLGASAFNMELEKLLESQDGWFGELLKQIVDLLYNEAENGLTLYQLKSKVDSIYTDENVMHAIHVLYTNQPILICRVGFEAVRYVHISFAKSWTISTNVSRYDVSNVKIRGAIEEASKKVDLCERKELIVPSIWTDANGSTTDVILRDCKDFLVDLILNKPGITEADIYRQAEMALSKRELRDVLNMLVEQQVLRQVCLSFPPKAVKKASVFNRLRTISCKNNNSIENVTQSCFWVTSKPYAFLN